MGLGEKGVRRRVRLGRNGGVRGRIEFKKICEMKDHPPRVTDLVRALTEPVPIPHLGEGTYQPGIECYLFAS